MINLTANVRSLFAALVLALFTTSFALAQTTENSGKSDRLPAGDADFGVIILVGLIGLFVLIAWLVSRMGPDGGRGGDHTML